MATTVPGSAAPEGVLRNLVQALQTDPVSYRHWGPWWWRLKRILKAAGYTREVFQGLGEEFPDHEMLHRWDDLDDRAFLLAALLDQYQNAIARWHSQWQADPDPERPEYFLLDPDVE